MYWAKICCIAAATQGTSRPGGAVLRRCRTELRAACADRAEPLRQARPCPGLDLAVPRRRLPPGRLEVLEPGVGLLDQQELVCWTLRGWHRSTSPVDDDRDARSSVGRR